MGDDAPPLNLLPEEPFYLPFKDGPFRMSMGLVARHPDEMISLDRHYPAQIEQRRSLVAEWGREVAAAEPGAEPALLETVEHLADLLPRRFPAVFERCGTAVHNRITGESWGKDADTLRALALLVQEDVCLLELRDGTPHLIAGTLCFSPGWRLQEKLGQALGMVHAKVPLYAGTLERPVDRLMRHLQRGKLVERFNWGLYDTDALFRPGRREHQPEITPDNALDRLHLRVERQTLSVLPQTGVVVFTIRTHVYPVRRVVATEGGLMRLGAAVRALPPEMALYKTIAPFRDALLTAVGERMKNMI